MDLYRMKYREWTGLAGAFQDKEELIRAPTAKDAETIFGIRVASRTTCTIELYDIEPL